MEPRIAEFLEEELSKFDGLSGVSTITDRNRDKGWPTHQAMLEIINSQIEGRVHRALEKPPQCRDRPGSENDGRNADVCGLPTTERTSYRWAVAPRSHLVNVVVV